MMNRLKRMDIKTPYRGDKVVLFLNGLDRFVHMHLHLPFIHAGEGISDPRPENLLSQILDRIAYTE
jgi:hypothetical protein